MANIVYEPTVWVGGKTVGTADIMNKIEQGIKQVVDVINSGEIGGGGDIPIEGLPEGEVLEISTNEDIIEIFN